MYYTLEYKWGKKQKTQKTNIYHLEFKARIFFMKKLAFFYHLSLSFLPLLESSVSAKLNV